MDAKELEDRKNFKRVTRLFLSDEDADKIKNLVQRLTSSMDIFIVSTSDQSKTSLLIFGQRLVVGNQHHTGGDGRARTPRSTSNRAICSSCPIERIAEG